MPSRASAAALVLLTAVVFLRSVTCDFVNWDDNQYVFENAVVRNPHSAAAVCRACTGVFVSNWAPVTMLSYQLDTVLFGDRPWGYHLTNVLLHALATGLFFLTFTRLTAAPARSFAAAMLFGIHPLRVESVTWISERKDVLSAVFLFTTLLAYEAYCRRETPLRFAAVVVSMTLGLMSKSMLVTLPALLILLDIWPLARVPSRGSQAAEQPGPAGHARATWQRLVGEKALLGGLALLFVAITLLTQQTAMAGAELPLWTARLPNAVWAVSWYVWKLFLPTGLHALYRHAGADLSTSVVVALGAIWLATIVVATRLGRWQPAIPWGLAWFLVTLLPVIGIVQVGQQGMADRYSYIPHVGLLIALVWAAADASAVLGLPRWVPGGICGLSAAVLAAMTVLQIGTWKDSVTLWTHALAIDAHNASPHVSLAVALDERGEKQRAEAEYRLALAIEPSQPLGIDNLSALLLEQRRYEEARAFVAAALRFSGGGLSHANHANLLLAEGRVAEARAAADRAVSADPGLPTARFTLGRVCQAQEDRPAAIAAYRETIRLDPQHVSARNNLANALARSGRLEEAIGEFRVLVTITPESAVAFRNYALALEQAGRIDEALAAWRAALERNPEDEQSAARLRALMARRSEPATPPAGHSPGGGSVGD